MAPKENVPTVSIGLPVFNGGKYIRSALDSLLSQTYDDFELIISDNASTDDTRDICLQYVGLDARVRYHRFDTNQGAHPNYNYIFKSARGRYFNWAAHDDEWHPDFLSLCVRAFEEGTSSIVLVYPKEHFIDEEGKIIEEILSRYSLGTRQHRAHRRLAHVLKVVGTAGALFGLMKTEALRKTRLLGPFIGSDWVLIAEMAMLGEIVELPQFLFRRRIHPEISSLACKNNDEWLAWHSGKKTQYKSILPPQMLLPREFIRGAHHLPIPRSEKWLCYLLVHPLWYFRMLRNFGGRMKNRLKRRLGCR
jgi:glycosyltransferase involved in cell wall biosynthesis